MAESPNIVTFSEDDGHFFFCRSCGNYILNAIGNSFFFRIEGTAADGEDVDGILCKANTPVNLRFDSITNARSHNGRPAVDVFCNEDHCSALLGMKFISGGRVLNGLPVQVYIGEGHEAVFLYLTHLLFWNGDGDVRPDYQFTDDDDQFTDDDD